MSNQPKPIDSARDLMARGFCVTPVAYRGKAAFLDNWTKLRLTDNDLSKHFSNGTPVNIGVLLGEPSGWLVDVDLDHSKAVELASQFLPCTGMIWGRQGNPSSHWIYRVTAPANSRKWKSETYGAIVELHSTGRQTVAPGSVHESGEAVVWYNDGEVATIAPDELFSALERLYAAVLAELGESPKARHERVERYTERPIPPVVACSPEALRPGDDYNRRGDVRALLETHGWLYDHQSSDGNEHFTRPDKDSGTSATLKPIDGVPTLYVFSSNAYPFEAEEGYAPFQVFTLLEHGGDFKKAASALHRQGYGTANASGVGMSAVDAGGGNSQNDEASIEPYQRFPHHILPPRLADFIEQGAKARVCDESFIALPMLAALGAAIGTTRQIELKTTWREFPTIWTAIVGESGSSKTPAFALATEHTNRMQKQAYDEYTLNMRDYAEAMAAYESEARKKNGNPGIRPEEPQSKRYLCSDLTVESIAMILRGNPKGFLVARDELSGWLGGMNRYHKGAAGSDEAAWLSLWSSTPITIDRKTSEPRFVHIQQAAVSIAGGIQPGTLQRVLGAAHQESGMAARILFAMPDRMAKVWTDDVMDSAVERCMGEVFDKLHALDHDRDPLTDEMMPRTVYLSSKARERWIRFYNEHNTQQTTLSGPMAAAWSKLEAYAARLALIVHMVRVASDDRTITSPIKLDEHSIEAGARLVEWFGREARRVYAMLGVSDGGGGPRPSPEDRLIAWVASKGGAVTVRDVTRGPQQYRGNAARAEEDLSKLVDAGLGEWVPEGAETPGRPTKQFRLFDNP